MIARRERIIATGYLACARRFGGDRMGEHHLTLEDTIDNLGRAILGQTDVVPPLLQFLLKRPADQAFVIHNEDLFADPVRAAFGSLLAFAAAAAADDRHPAAKEGELLLCRDGRAIALVPGREQSRLERRLDRRLHHSQHGVAGEQHERAAVASIEDRHDLGGRRGRERRRPGIGHAGRQVEDRLPRVVELGGETQLRGRMRPEAAAVIFIPASGGEPRRMSYAAFFNGAARYAEALRAVGVGPRDLAILVLALNVASVSSVFNRLAYKPFARLSGILAISLLAGGLAVLVLDLGRPPEQLFRSFEREPFAAASIGQIHRVRTHGGRELALKVQFPGVAKSVDSDVDNVASLLRRLDFLPLSLDIDALVVAAVALRMMPSIRVERRPTLAAPAPPAA